MPALFLRSWFTRSYSKRQKVLDAFIKQQFNYRPKDISLYETALRHSSAAKKIKGGIKNSNERLEYLGDAVLDMIVADFLFEKFPFKPEGELTKMKAKVVNRKTLNALGKELGLSQIIQKKLNKLEKHQSIIGNALEALVGAMYLDIGYKRTKVLIVDILIADGIEENVHRITDYKSVLHEWCQKQKKSLTFEVISEVQAAGRSAYEIEVSVDNQMLGKGEAKSKKAAEQLAAKTAWISLGFSE